MVETKAGLTAVGTEGGGTAAQTLGCTTGDELGVCWRHVELAWGGVLLGSIGGHGASG